MGVPYLRLISPALKGGVLRRVRIMIYIVFSRTSIVSRETISTLRNLYQSADWRTARNAGD